MPVISLTRLRVRSLRHMPGFLWYTYRSERQLTRSPGFLEGTLATAPSWTFWTITAWADEASMKRFRDTDWHKAAMPRLLDYCDEASLARWTQDTADLPTAAAMVERLTSVGRISKVRHPTPGHAAGQTVPDGQPPKPRLRIKPGTSTT
jgi:heme-degrading monooxygenase HmoA